MVVDFADMMCVPSSIHSGFEPKRTPGTSFGICGRISQSHRGKVTHGSFGGVKTLQILNYVSEDAELRVTIVSAQLCSKIVALYSIRHILRQKRGGHQGDGTVNGVVE